MATKNIKTSQGDGNTNSLYKLSADYLVNVYSETVEFDLNI